MLEILLFGLWFFLPGGIANAAPVFAAKIEALDFLGVPLDFGKTWRHKRIFGDHKTWRGLLVGVAVAILVAIAQSWFYDQNLWLQDNVDTFGSGVSFAVVSGFLLGFGALAGDAVKSFFKRRFNLPSGSSWVPYDQIDYVIGGLAFYSLLEVLSLEQYLSVAFVWVVIHPLATFVGWLLRLKDSPI